MLQISKILGLDLGTNSIGWAVVENDREGNKETFKLQDKGVVIFSEGVKKEGSTTNLMESFKFGKKKMTKFISQYFDLLLI